MSRFFVGPEAIHGDTIVVTGKEAHHITRVMRLTVSDAVIVFDGSGAEYAGVIRDVSPRAITIAVTAKREASGANSYAITLLQAIPKKEKMEYIVEKATELGVGTILPVMTARTIPQWDAGKAEAQVKRWRMIAREASKQCGRPVVPVVEQITGLSGALSKAAPNAVKLMAALVPDAEPLKTVLGRTAPGDTVIAIGPEGDFAPEEVDLARGSGFIMISLGSRVLKSDTAGLALLSVVAYAYDA